MNRFHQLLAAGDRSLSGSFPRLLMAVTLFGFGSLPVIAEDVTTLPEHAVLEKVVERGDVAGIVTAVVRPNGKMTLDHAGYADLESRRPMQNDNVFWIASMTKPITGLAICKLEEEGKLKLEDTVDKFIPEFANLKNANGEPVKITILQLMTHTSGLQEIPFDVQANCQSLEEMIPLFLEHPVKFQPGERWEYSQSSINTTGRIVEILSGKRFEDYLADEFFTPLGMHDTTFFLTEEQASRLASTYHVEGEKFIKVPPADLILQGKSPTFRDRASAPNGGLFSTAPDLGRFYHMLLNEGELDGVRIVKPETVVRLRTMATPAGMLTGLEPGASWGVGVCVIRDPGQFTSLMSVGSFGHDGAYGTQSWIDLEKKYALIVLVQRTNYLGPTASGTRKEFQEAILSTLDN